MCSVVRKNINVLILHRLRTFSFSFSAFCETFESPLLVSSLCAPVPLRILPRDCMFVSVHGTEGAFLLFIRF